MLKKRKGHIERIHLTIDRVGTEISQNDEKRVIEAFTTHFPLRKPLPWLTNVRHADTYEEGLGIDIIFETDVGPVYLQIKGSDFGHTQFCNRQKRGEVSVEIICVVINPAMDHAKIVQKLLGQLSGERKARKNKSLEQSLFPTQQTTTKTDPL